MAGQKLVPISLLANSPLRVEERTRKMDDGAGGLVERKVKFPVWFEATACGRTPMCQALGEATKTVTEFVDKYPDCYPPLVINISDGKATDGYPELAAFPLRELKSSDGNVLLFNAHISSDASRPIEYPSLVGELPDHKARVLFRMSSHLPPKMRDAAKGEGFQVDDESRGFVFNADLVSVLRFLDIGTRLASTRGDYATQLELARLRTPEGGESSGGVRGRLRRRPALRPICGGRWGVGERLCGDLGHNLGGQVRARTDLAGCGPAAMATTMREARPALVSGRKSRRWGLRHVYGRFVPGSESVARRRRG
jgi:hypothetical protein